MDTTDQPGAAYLVIDTETSGLFDFKRPADAEGQPRLASIAMITVNGNMEIEGERNFLIKPDGWEMQPGATEVNGLTTEFLTEHGVPVAEVLQAYHDAIVVEDRIVVAHNAQHDCKQVRAEFRRAGLPDLFEQTRNICTMRGLHSVCRIPNVGRGGIKFPKLSEACDHFGIPHGDAHSAMGDAKACLELLRKMVELDVLPEAKVHYAKNPPQAKEAADTFPAR